MNEPVVVRLLSAAHHARPRGPEAWNLIRTRLRHVPLDRRRRWMRANFESWLEVLLLDPELRKKHIALPSLQEAEQICADLIGAAAME